MASAGSLSRKTSEVSCEINFDGVFTNEVRGKVVTEIIKQIIYQRGQIPLPVEQLKRYVDQVKLSFNDKQWDDLKSSDEKVSSLDDPSVSEIRPSRSIPIQGTVNEKPIGLPVESKHRKIIQVFQSFSDLFERVSCIVGCVNSTVKDVLLLIGGTHVSPRELFLLKLPDPDKIICAKHEQPKLSLRSCMVRVFREVITKNGLWEGGNTSITNISVLVKMSRQDQISSNMEPLLSYSLPKKASIKVIFPITNNCLECRTECAETDDVLEDASNCLERLKIDDSPEEKETKNDIEVEPQFIWVRILPVVKGFANSLLVTTKQTN